MNGTAVTVVWGSAGERLAAFAGGQEHFEKEWLEKARKAASPAEVSLLVASDPGAPRTADAADTPDCPPQRRRHGSAVDSCCDTRKRRRRGAVRGPTANAADSVGCRPRSRCGGQLLRRPLAHP